MSQRKNAHKQSTMIAFCGVAVALVIVLMMTSSIIPVMTYAAPLYAGIILLPVMIEFGKKAAWTTYAAGAVLSLLIVADKEAAFFYIFLGYYPIIKWDLERKVRSKWPQLLLKIAFFLMSVVLMYCLIAFVLHLDAIVAEFGEMGKVLTVLFVLGLVLCMMIYDKLLFPVSLIYMNKIKPRLRLH